MSPGFSGWAQVCAPYASSIDDSEFKLSYDLFYLRHFSTWLDLIIFSGPLKLFLRLLVVDLPNIYLLFSVAFRPSIYFVLTLCDRFFILSKKLFLLCLLLNCPLFVISYNIFILS